MPVLRYFPPAQCSLTLTLETTGFSSQELNIKVVRRAKTCLHKETCVKLPGLTVLYGASLPFTPLYPGEQAEAPHPFPHRRASVPVQPVQLRQQRYLQAEETHEDPLRYALLPPRTLHLAAFG